MFSRDWSSDVCSSDLGADEARTAHFDSPFDYHEQMTLHVETQLPEPGDPAFIPAAMKRIEHYKIARASSREPEWHSGRAGHVDMNTHSRTGAGYESSR